MSKNSKEKLKKLLEKVKNTPDQIIEEAIDSLSETLKEEEFDKYYNKLVELVRPLYQWFEIDKVKTYGVFVYTKDKLEDCWNIFDIYDDEVYFFEPEEYNAADLPQGSLPVIAAIQEQLRYGKKIGIYK